MAILAHSAGSPACVWRMVICSKTVTVSPFCRWPRTSPTKEACPRRLTAVPLTVAVAGGFKTTLFLTVGAFLFGAAGTFSGAGAGAGVGAIAAGGATGGAGLVSCTWTATAVSGANAESIQTFSFIMSQE